MQIIPLGFTITRDVETGKKRYNGKPIPALPGDWQTYNKTIDTLPKTYAIRPDKDIIVIDCDSLESTKAIDTLNTTNSYIVVSDKGEKHFYFKPSEYYKASQIGKRPNRVKVNDIDVLQGNSLVFTACEGNETKRVHKGDLTELEEIPDTIVDYLVENLTRAIQNYSGDYTATMSYMGPKIEDHITLYLASRDYTKHIEPVMRIVTPKAFHDMVKPDFHPNRIPDGEGTNYIQALSSKIAGDPSISVEIHTNLIDLITTHLWEQPWPASRLNNFLSNLTTQTYPDGTPVFRYIPNMTQDVLVSANEQGYTKIYRTPGDNYILPRPNGSVLEVQTQGNLKKILQSKNYVVRFEGRDLTYQELNANMMTRLTSSMETVSLVHRSYLPSGESVLDEELIYNTYQPTAYLAIIRGEHLQHEIGPDKCPPTIKKILDSLTRDHKKVEREKIQKLFHEYVSHKLKTLEHTVLIFHFMGQQGTGKDALLDGVLGIISQSVGEADFTSGNAQFNADWGTRMFVKLPEIKVNSKVQNVLKQFSGSEKIKVQEKRIDATYQRNTVTFMASSNSTDMLTTQTNDRRVVTLSSFTGNKLSQSEVNKTLVALELRDYCLFLRDLAITVPLAYSDANYWHDETMEALLVDEAESYKDDESKLKLLMDKKFRLEPDEFKQQLEEIASVYFCTSTGNLSIPLKGQLTNGTEIITNMTNKRVRATGFKLTRDLNKKYVRPVYCIRLEVPIGVARVLGSKIEEISDTELDLS